MYYIALYVRSVRSLKPIRSRYRKSDGVDLHEPIVESMPSQVVGAKIMIPGEELVDRGNDVSRRDEELFVQKVNAILPNTVRVYRCIRVENRFHARTATSSRTYGYFLPEFALIKRDDPGQKRVGSLFELRQAIQCFVGSNVFHNFTDKLGPKDPRARRVIESFTASEPVEVNGKRVIRLQVKGQSFLKHHIRRMVGYAIECVRYEENPKDLILEALSVDKIVRDSDMPLAPAEALFLDIASFDYYNTGLNKKNKKGDEDFGREAIDFVTDGTVRRAREALISEVILPAVFSTGGAFEAFEKWIEQRNSVKFPPSFLTVNISPQLSDAYEFVRCVERDRAKRAKMLEWSRQSDNE